MHITNTPWNAHGQRRLDQACVHGHGERVGGWVRTLELGERGVAVVAEGPGEEVGDEEDERVHVARHHRVGTQEEPRAGAAAPVLREPRAPPADALTAGGLHVVGRGAKRHLYGPPRTENLTPTAAR